MRLLRPDRLVVILVAAAITVGVLTSAPAPLPPINPNRNVTERDVVACQIITWDTTSCPARFYPWGHYEYVWGGGAWGGVWVLEGETLTLFDMPVWSGTLAGEGAFAYQVRVPATYQFHVRHDGRRLDCRGFKGTGWNVRLER